MKRTLGILLSLLLLISLSACKKNDLEDFKGAIEKTSQITKGSMTVQSKIDMEFNINGLEENEIKTLNYLKNVAIDMNLKFDDDEKKVIAKNYLNFGGLGFDLDFYLDKDKAYFKMPMLGKYIVMSDLKKDTENGGQLEEIDENFIDFKGKLNELLQEDNVFSGEETIITTQEGEVKATEYNINLNDEQIKDLLNDIIIELFNNMEDDEKFSKYLEIKRREVDSKENVDFKGLLKDFNEAINKSTIEDFNYTAFVDIDGYIVKEDIVFEIDFNNIVLGKITGLRYQFSSEKWNINEKQDFDYPKITDNNTLDIENITEGIPFMIEDMMKIK